MDAEEEDYYNFYLLECAFEWLSSSNKSDRQMNEHNCNS